MLQGKSHCICKLHISDQILGSKPLLRNWLLQMDNCVKNNKNSTFVSVSVIVDSEGSKFVESFHDFTRETVHFSTDSRGSRF